MLDCLGGRNNNGSLGGSANARNGHTATPFASFPSSFNNTGNRGATPLSLLEAREHTGCKEKKRSMFSCSYNFDVLKIDNCSRQALETENNTYKLIVGSALKVCFGGYMTFRSIQLQQLAISTSCIFSIPQF